MNPPGLADEIRIEGADDDAGVLLAPIMQRDEVFTVDRQHDPLIGGRVCQHALVGQLAIRITGFLDRDHVVTQTPELLNDGQREVLVGVESGHDLRGLVLLNLLLYFVPVGAKEGPRIG